MSVLKVNKRYILYFEIGERQLTYVCTILEIDNRFVKIQDKYDKIYTLSLDALKQITEMEE